MGLILWLKKILFMWVSIYIKKPTQQLPNTPKYICDVNLEAGTRLRTGEVNPLFGFDGGGQQYDLIINGKNVGIFTNERIIGQ